MKDDLKHQYELRFSENHLFRSEVWKILARSFFQRYVPLDGAILDLGCGWGEFINNIEAKKRIGMDLNSAIGQRLAPGIEFLNEDCSTEWSVGDASLDCVFTSNFLEHLADKDHVDRTLRQVGRCLKPGGRLICIGPNIRHVGGSYWDFWDHRVAISDRSLVEILRLRGFVVEQSVGKFLPFTMANKIIVPLFLLRIYLGLPVLWGLFGKQFLIVARNGR